MFTKNENYRYDLNYVKDSLLESKIIKYVNYLKSKASFKDNKILDQIEFTSKWFKLDRIKIKHTSLIKNNSKLSFTYNLSLFISTIKPCLLYFKLSILSLVIITIFIVVLDVLRLISIVKIFQIIYRSCLLWFITESNNHNSISQIVLSILKDVLSDIFFYISCIIACICLLNPFFRRLKDYILRNFQIELKRYIFLIGLNTFLKMWYDVKKRTDPNLIIENISYISENLYTIFETFLNDILSPLINFAFTLMLMICLYYQFFIVLGIIILCIIQICILFYFSKQLIWLINIRSMHLLYFFCTLYDRISNIRLIKYSFTEKSEIINIDKFLQVEAYLSWKIQIVIRDIKLCFMLFWYFNYTFTLFISLINIVIPFFLYHISSNSSNNLKLLNLFLFNFFNHKIKVADILSMNLEVFINVIYMHKEQLSMMWHMNLNMFSFIDDISELNQNIIIFKEKLSKDCISNLNNVFIQNFYDNIFHNNQRWYIDYVIKKLKNFDIKINDLSVYYQEQLVFKNINLYINEGENILLQGPSGSGKTTLINVIRGLINDKNINKKVYLANWNDLSISIKNRLIGILEQDTLLFNSSILENIIYGLNYKEIRKEDIELACKKAQILNLIYDKKEQWAFNIGYQGCKLSGGQKKRIGIARILLNRYTKYVMVDEATAGLDAWSALKVTKALENLYKHKTVIEIAHNIVDISIYHKILTVVPHLKDIKLKRNVEFIAKD